MPDNLGTDMTENDILRQLIVEENDAVISYTERARQVSDPRIRAVLLDIAEEEKVHAGELSALLSESDPEHDASMIEGAEEVETVETEIEKSWRAFKSVGQGNQTSVEDKIDVLLAQNQEIQVDTARTADLVPAVLGDRAEEDYEEEEAEMEGGEPSEADDADPYAMLDGIGDGMDDEGSDIIEDDVSYEVEDEGSDIIEDDESEEESDIIEDEEESDIIEDEEESDIIEDEYEPDFVSDIIEEDESEEEPELEEDEPEPEEESEDEDKKDDVSKAVPRQRIRPLGTGVKKLVKPVSAPPASVRAGGVTKAELMNAYIDDDSEPIMLGQGIDPETVVKKDLDAIKALMGFRL